MLRTGACIALFIVVVFAAVSVIYSAPPLNGDACRAAAAQRFPDGSVDPAGYNRAVDVYDACPGTAPMHKLP